MVNTHLKIDTKYSGKIVKQSKDYAEIELKTTKEMLADKQGLIHGGFTFSAADYAAMVAINEPHVVLTGADVKFLAPVKLNDTIIFKAQVIQSSYPKAKVEVIGSVEDKEVFKGVFKTYVTNIHILERK